MPSDGIAIVGLACRYPDANSPADLWDNVLAQRRAFRRIPDTRLRAADYVGSGPHALDLTYVKEAALIEGYEFDRLNFRVANTTYEAVDLTHWLALDVTAEAIEDAGFADGSGLPKETTGVIIGNTLTGEISRSNLLRTRWPYVRRLLATSLADRGWSTSDCDDFLSELETRYKAPFPPIGTDSLAGGLSNTIAGRICNHFDLNGGGYTVDGACAASTLSIITACNALTNCDLDVAIAGGVDISLDPFELVGFARLGALSDGVMRVYDANPTGFLPGEGCGIAVLMRLADAIADGHRIYAAIRGWGVSSDGKGGITRPEVDGQLLAIQRAYHKAGFGAHTVGYFEGHGTGTRIGDATELEALIRALEADGSRTRPSAIGSIKANIGHTKAAAGIASVIKAALALKSQIIPPTTGCQSPHPKLAEAPAALRILHRAERWHDEEPLRAAVSAMGFGGINTHLVLDRVGDTLSRDLTTRERMLIHSAQDCELFLFAGDDPANLAQSLNKMLEIAPALSYGELGDLAINRAAALVPGPYRAAVVATSPADLAEKLRTLLGQIAADPTIHWPTIHWNVEAGTFMARSCAEPRVGLLFPGQAAPVYLDGGALARRLPSVRAVYAAAKLADGGEPRSTAVAQPAIVAADLAALECLRLVGIEPQLSVGHSLGELVAFHWAGAFDASRLMQIAQFRGQIMDEVGVKNGAMARVNLEASEVRTLIEGRPVKIACLNGPREIVISGSADAVEEIVANLRARGISAQRLPVSLAFHSPLVAPAARVLADYLGRLDFQPLKQPVVSTVTGDYVPLDADLPDMLTKQIIEPVRFMDAVAQASQGLDLWIEAGPGMGLARLAHGITDVPVVSIDAGGPSLGGFLKSVGAAHTLGATVDCEALFESRFTRPFDEERRQIFITNPCERAPKFAEDGFVQAAMSPEETVDAETPVSVSTTDEPLDIIRHFVAQRTEIPASRIGDDDRFLSDLHLDSITVSELVTEAARFMGKRRPVEPMDFADASIAEVATALDRLDRSAEEQGQEPQAATPPGIDTWVRCFTVELVERERRRTGPNQTYSGWRVYAPDDHPLAEPLRHAFGSEKRSGGVVVCLSPDPDDCQMQLLLDGVHAALENPSEGRFVLVQHGGGAAAIARTLHLEARALDVAVVDLPLDHPAAVDWILAEALAVSGFCEAHFDRAGTRREPELHLLPPPKDPPRSPLGPQDVLLVTGGGKGICAETALRLAESTGVRLALIGRADPASDPVLAENLERMAENGVQLYYHSADVTDATAVRAAVSDAERHLGPITALLHGAARNLPCPLANLEIAELRATLGPKVQGLQNILEALDCERLRLLIAFGSIIARGGLPGAGHYGLANELQTRHVERFQAAHPNCRCLALEWSIWSQIGMGARLGSVERLAGQGIDAIAPDQGVAVLEELLRRDLPAVAVTITSRFGQLPTLQLAPREPLFYRFLETVHVFYPDIELVADAKISWESDPYLEDHVLGGESLFPGVMGLEAMAQAAMAVTGARRAPHFEDVRFDRIVIVPKDCPTTIRLAALVRDNHRVDVVLRSSSTDFQVDHFRATCRFDDEPVIPTETVIPTESGGLDRLNGSIITLNLERDLYGSILFHGARFRRVRGYRWLHAKSCVAEIAPGDSCEWFGRYLPADLVLGDPGARDAAIHAIQACIPHRTLVPIAIERLEPGLSGSCGPWLACASERSGDGTTFVYDLEIRSFDGEVVEKCSGLVLKAVDNPGTRKALPHALLGPYFERCLHDLLPEPGIQVAIECAAELPRRDRGKRAVRHAVAEDAKLIRRFDGKPELADCRGVGVSIAHAGEVTLAVVGRGPIGCDVEIVVRRPAVRWRDLLGSERFQLAELIARECAETVDAAGTRVWAASESLKKAGLAAKTPLLFASATPDGWVRMTAGSSVAMTYVEPVGKQNGQLCIAILAEIHHARV